MRPARAGAEAEPWRTLTVRALAVGGSSSPSTFHRDCPGGELSFAGVKRSAFALTEVTNSRSVWSPCKETGDR